MQRQTRLLNDTWRRSNHRFYPTKKEQERLEVYKESGPEVFSEYNENFFKFKMSLK